MRYIQNLEQTEQSVVGYASVCLGRQLECGRAPLNKRDWISDAGLHFSNFLAQVRNPDHHMV